MNVHAQPCPFPEPAHPPTTAVEREAIAADRREWDRINAHARGPALPPRPPRPPPPPEPRKEQVQQGKPYLYRGKPYMAGLVNASRCQLDPLFRTRRFIRDHWQMRTIEILTRPPSVSIAARAELEPLIIVRRK